MSTVTYPSSCQRSRSDVIVPRPNVCFVLNVSAPDHPFLRSVVADDETLLES